MYKIEWDEENNYPVLKNENAVVGNEYRPVFSAELKKLGFEQFITFEESETAPVLFAFRYQYYYRGRAVAQLIDNGCIRKPSIEILDESFVGTHLTPIDLADWFRKNKKLMDQLVQDTLLRIYRVYMEWKDKVDYIDVAFSGGKDSMVLLDLVKRVLPKDSYFVSWIDSGMERRESVEAIQREMERCRKDGIAFWANHSIMNSLEAWETIGPPSFDNRWCCSVLQSVPNTIQMKERLGKKDAKGLIFLGNRAAESSQRMKSMLVNEGVKHKNQVDANGIINWNSLEVFLYLMMNGIELNRAYIEGYLRIGCLLCPRASTISLGFAYGNDPEEIEPYYNVIRNMYRDGFESEEALNEYINLGEWRFRKDAQGTRYHIGYREYVRDGFLHIALTRPKTDWQMWIKTIGIVKSAETDEEAPQRMRYTLLHAGREYAFAVVPDGDGLDIAVSAEYEEAFLHLFKTVFRKAVSCIGCRTCEVNCPNDHLRFVNGALEIDDGCLHCSQCHSGKHGCVVFDSWFETNQVI